MKQEDKELLLQDLCARLPHHAKVNINGKIETLDAICDDAGYYFNFLNDNEEGVNIEQIKPYLFPISNITKEQEEEYGECFDIDLANSAKNLNDKLDGKDVINGFPMYNHIDWLNKNHFDYRGLIEKGLAIDATELNIY